MGMTESKKAQAVSALRQCAKEHEKDFTYTFNIRVSDLCNDIADYVEELQKENEVMKNVVKLLIATLNDTTWDEGHPGYADSEPGYRCPNCSCKDCYRISCKYNESELFKKLYKDFPELYEK